MQCNFVNLLLGMAPMHKCKMPTQDFAKKLKCHVRDAEMGAEASKVHLVPASNEDTLHNLDHMSCSKEGR